MAEKATRVVGNSHFVAATGFVVMAIEGYNRHLENLAVTMHLVIVGSNFVEGFTIVEVFAIGFD